MSTRFDIKCVFDKNSLENIDKILTWISNHSVSNNKVELKFSNKTTKTLNFSHGFKSARLDFSKGIPSNNEFDIVFELKKDDGLLNNLKDNNYKEEELNAIEENSKPGYLNLGYFYLKIRERRDEFELDFWAATFDMGHAFMASKTARNILIGFCNEFNPKRGYVELDSQEDEVFWPKNIKQKGDKHA